MPSFGSVIRKAISGDLSAGSFLSLEQAIHNSLLNNKPASFEELHLLSKKLSAHLKLKDAHKSAEIFAELYIHVINLRPRSKRSIHPSTIDGDCSRMVYYDLNNYPYVDKVDRGIDGKTQLIFDMGSWFHHYAQTLLFKAGVLEAAEVPVQSEEYKIDGRADGILKIGKKRRLLEIKTMNSNYFKFLNKPMPHHIKQAGIYATILAVDEIHFLYFNKDTCEIKEFIVPVDKKELAPIFDKITNIVKTKKAPARECKTIKDKRALACPFRTTCFNSKS